MIITLQIIRNNESFSHLYFLIRLEAKEDLNDKKRERVERMDE